MANVNWIKIKNEYISGNISHRKLAEKYNVSYNTLKDRAKREDWTLSKQSQHSKITARTQQKTAEEIAKKESDYIVNINKLNYDIAELLKEMLTEKRTTIKARDIKSLSGALKDIQDIQSTATGGNKNTETNKLDIIMKKILNKD